MVDFLMDHDEFDVNKINEPWPDDLEKVVAEAQAEMFKRYREARVMGFVFDPIVGYTPWGHDGPATENRSWN